MTSTADRRRTSGQPSFIFVGGKGGVGKTTCAAAAALAAARRGRRTLVVSVDPAPSLGDALSGRLGPVPVRIPAARGALEAAEVDAARALERWLSRRRATLARVALRGTWLDADDVARLLRLSLPGIDEMAALFEIARFAGSRRYDLIVVDTAPTGHTLRLFALPETIRAVARVFDAMQAKHRAMAAAIRGRWTPDEDDELIAAIDRDAREWIDRFRDPHDVELHWVTLPEAMAIEETRDAVEALAAQGMAVSRVVVNRLTPPPPSRCEWCTARRALDARAVRSLRKALPAIPATGLLARDTEPRGIRALTSMGAELQREIGPAEAGHYSATRTAAIRCSVRLQPDSRLRLQPDDRAACRLAGVGTRLLLFGGKGGVGKTTAAAAAAIEIAARDRTRRVLLISTDPAHSLGDALGQALDDTRRPVIGGPANLEARELDAGAAFRRIRDRYAGAVAGAFDRLGGGLRSGAGLDASFDRAVMEGLIDLAPPGVDELSAIIEVVDALDGAGPDRPDVIVIDTAPSGHALRLLKMPAIVQEWTRVLMSMLLKYQSVVGLGDLGPMLLKLSQGLGRLRELLTDPARTRFVAVTRASALARAETGRLLAELGAMAIDVPAIVVNAVGRGRCSRCRRAVRAEAREIAGLQRLGRGKVLIVAPVALPPPHGARSLRRWARQWRATRPTKPGNPRKN